MVGERGDTRAGAGSAGASVMISDTRRGPLERGVAGPSRAHRRPPRGIRMAAMMCMFRLLIHIMRTNVVLDDELVAEAMKASGARTKREAIELGLKALLQMRRQAEFKRLKGQVRWVGDLDAMRRDR